VTVHFVGAGPGAADLITLRAAALLREAAVVLYPGTYLDAEVLSHCRADARLVDTAHLDLDQIVAELAAAHEAGLDAVRLASGDPSVYSAVAEQSRRLDELGVPWDVTPGVPAYAAAAAVVGRELTVPLVAQSVVLTRVQARSTAMPETEALSRFAATRATLVLHLAITRTREVMTELSGDYGADCPVVVG
jgi:precorrin-4/cobalt-precorrin-4 C11-methyltransferase